MTSQQPGSVRWRQTTILIRTDIFEAARTSGTDISRECNRALAGMLGIDFSQQEIPEHAGNPVIIAKEGAAGMKGSGGRAASKQLHPVLNAEDPQARAHLLKMKKGPAARQEPGPAPGPAGVQGDTPRDPEAGEPADVPAPVAPAHPAARKKPEGKARGKKGKDDPVRRFVTNRILRTEPGGKEPDRIAKDELYSLYVRWHKENAGKSGTLPDKRTFTVALKNRFAMEETVADGIRYWKNVKLR